MGWLDRLNISMLSLEQAHKIITETSLVPTPLSENREGVWVRDYTET